MLTQGDIEEINRILEEKIKFLPTKEDFYSRMDSLSGQMKKIQETLDLHDGQHNDIHDHEEETDKRLNTIENTLDIPHPIST